jgi:hypothetical protein
MEYSHEIEYSQNKIFAYIKANTRIVSCMSFELHEEPVEIAKAIKSKMDAIKLGMDLAEKVKTEMAKLA